MADKNTKVLSKLIIHAFEKNDFKKEVDSFSTPINPETFTKTSHIELDTSRGHGQPGTDPRYKSTAPEELKIEFILDGTKTMEGYLDSLKTMEVSDQIQAFTDCVQFDGKIHRPRFLIVRWGSEVKFPCVLSHLEINYSLFKANGDPLRAKISATFIKYETEAAIFAANHISSPDLTHQRVAKAGDRLDLLTYDIYDDSSFFLQVARANDLTSPRNLKAGISLFFPPIDKNDA
jgi:Contractile injection system tube protein